MKVTALLLLTLLAAGWAMHNSYKEALQWSEFAHAHHCEVIDSEENAGLTFVPNRITYHCDDGIHER